MSYLPHTRSDRYTLDKALMHIRVALKDKAKDFDSIVVSGLSGIIPGAIIAHEMRKNLYAVRRVCEMNGTREEGRTHGQMVEGPGLLGRGRYIILDDFISNGNTVKRVLKEFDQPEFLVLYHPHFTGKASDPDPYTYGEDVISYVKGYKFTSQEPFVYTMERIAEDSPLGVMQVVASAGEVA